MSAMLEAALAYAEHGWMVFALGANRLPLANCPPCNKRLGGTCPGQDACSCAVDTCHAFYKATTDLELVEEWWGRRGYAGIGIRCGAPSGLAVLDIDGHAGGTESLAALEREHGVLPGTLLQCSGSGTSVHMVYEHPGHKVAPSASKLAPGLDVRGDGSYIVAAPTLHPKTGRPYSWHGDAWREPAARWPAVLDSLLLPAADTTWGQIGLRIPRQHAVARAAGALDFLRGAQPGERNVRLHWTACRFAELIASGQVAEDPAVEVLLDAARDLQLSDGEARGTILSALRAPLRRDAA